MLEPDISSRILAKLSPNGVLRRDLGLMIYIRKRNTTNKHVIKKSVVSGTGAGPGSLDKSKHSLSEQ